MAAQDEVLAAGTSIGKYRVVRLLGVGGMGAVYEAEHPELDRRVAIKTLLRSISANPEARARFLREGRAASKVRHPNVVEIYDVGTDNDLTYLVMELLEGEDLASRLARDGAIPAERAVDLMLPVLAAMQAAHEEGVLHRDLKPDNIFLMRTRHGVAVPKLVDFGISKIADGQISNLTMDSAVLGTPQYMSPEQAQGRKDIDARSDQYALGVILFEMLTGRKPFEHDQLFPLIHAIVSGDRPTLVQLKPDLRPELAEIIEKAMHRQREQRFGSVLAFARALLPFASGRARAVWEPVFLVVDSQPHAPAPSLMRTEVRLDGDNTVSTPLARERIKTPSLEEEPVVLPVSAGSRLGVMLAIGVAVVAVGGLGIGAAIGVLQGGHAATHAASAETSTAAPVTTRELALTVDPPNARVLLDGAPVSGSRLVLPIADQPHVLRVEAEGFAAQEISFMGTAAPTSVRLASNMPVGVPEPEPAGEAVPPRGVAPEPAPVASEERRPGRPAGRPRPDAPRADPPRADPPRASAPPPRPAAPAAQPADPPPRLAADPPAPPPRPVVPAVQGTPILD